MLLALICPLRPDISTPRFNYLPFTLLDDDHHTVRTVLRILALGRTYRQIHTTDSLRVDSRNLLGIPHRFD